MKPNMNLGRGPYELCMQKEFESKAQGRPVHGDKADDLSEKELEQLSGGDEGPKEAVTFEYGGLQVHYTQQTPTGSTN